MKTLTARTLICSLCLLFSMGILSAQENPDLTQGLGFSGGLTSGTGFTYRYLPDWGYQVSGFALYLDQGSPDQQPTQIYFLGTSVMKQLFFHATKDKNFHAQLYAFWGVTLFGGSMTEAPGFGLSLSTGPGIGLELGIFRHLALYTEVSQGMTLYLIRPDKYAPVDAGVLLGTGLLYRF